MTNKIQNTRSNLEKIILIVVVIVVIMGITYMIYDYVITMEQLDNIQKEMTENLSLTRDSNINSIWNDTDR